MLISSGNSIYYGTFPIFNVFLAVLRKHRYLPKGYIERETDSNSWFE